MSVLSAISAILLEKSRANYVPFVILNPMSDIGLTCGFANRTLDGFTLVQHDYYRPFLEEI
tara:strand:+ start:130 stop:312 length:183 start_codon:yes stop_codon:yes gene_type:complete